MTTSGFTKLFNSIITSSIWSEDDKVRIMWITFLAASDAKGFVSGTVPGMAAIARMSIPEAEKAIQKLESPDPYSRSSKHEGARVIKGNDGWLITNYLKYRQKRDPEKRRRQNRESQRRYKEKQKVTQSKQKISQSKPESAQAEAEAEADKDIRQKSNDFRLANLLLDLILSRKPDFKKPKLEKWAIHISRMIRLDGRLPERIEQVIRWCQADSGNGSWSGWQNNVLSTEKLRKQFDTLELSMGSKRDGTVKAVLFDKGAAAQREKMLAVGAKQ